MILWPKRPARDWPRSTCPDRDLRRLVEDRGGGLEIWLVLVIAVAFVAFGVLRLTQLGCS